MFEHLSVTALPQSFAHRLRLVCLAALFWLGGVDSVFAQSYTVYTGQTGAQTQIDVNHWSSWYIQVKSGTVSLVGGNFQMKSGSAAVDTVTLTLRSGGPGGSVITAVTQNATAFTGSFSTVLFTFPSAPTLAVGNYYLSLTSTASDVQSLAFFIKQPDSAFISLDGTTPIAPTTATISAAPPDANLTVAKSATANVTVGGTITYTISLGNDGGGTSGTSATVRDQLPAGVAATARTAGTNVSSVNCGTLPSAPGALLTCTVTLTSGIIAATGNGASFTITATAASTPGTVTNYASVDPDGGNAPAAPGASCVTTSCASASTVVAALPVPDLTVTATHAGNFSQGQTGATYTITARNSGTAATSGTVTVTDTVPAKLTPTAASGTGWSCGIASQVVTCTRSDALAAASNYPVITLTVSVAADAPASVTNVAAVSGGGESNTGNNSASDPTTVLGGPDFTLAKSHAGNFTQGQSGATYTLTASNAGASASSGMVTVSDPVPAGLTPTAATGTGWTCSLAGQNVSCTRSDALAASTSYPAITLTVNVAANATNVTNTASVSGGGDVNAANNSASDATTVAGTPDLTLTKTHSGNFTQGQIGATYTIAVTNSGSGASSGAVIVSDTVPAGLTPTAAAGSGWTCNVSGQDVSCTRADALAASSSFPAITLTVNVAGNAANLTNSVSVSGGGDVNAGNNSASDPTTIGNGPDLTLTKTHSGSFTQGQIGATYALTATNSGGTATSGLVTVSDPVPAGLTPTAAAGSGWTCSLAGQNVSCTRSDALAASTSFPAITLTVTVAANATNLTNTASVSGGGDVNAANNAASDATTIAGTPDLTLTKSHSGNFTQGQTGAAYTIAVTNSGTAPTSGAVTVTDTVPAGLTPTAAAGSGWTCNVSGQDVSCTRSDALAASTSFPGITLTVNVAANASNLTNTASVSGGGDVNAGNNSVSDATTIGNGADLTLTKSHSGNFTQGQTGATYTLTVANAGGTATSGLVTVSDAVPAGLTPTAAAGSGWTCNVSGQNVSCTRSDALAASASHPAITLTVNVAANATNVTNTASVSGGGDVNAGNNSASDATTIGGTADLTLAKSHGGSFTQGQTGATYTIAVTNSGTAPTSGAVTVSDTVPAGLTPTGASGTGWTCNVSGQDVSCTRGDAVAASASYPAITLTVNVAANATNVTNTASVSGGGDVNAGNNSASDATTIGGNPDLTLTKSHSGNFTQGQTGAAYTIAVTNSGTAPTSGAVTVSDTVPAGLTPTAAAGSGWTCNVSGQDVSCTRGDALAASASYPAITLTVNVAANAANLTNTSSVSGGGDVNAGNNSVSDATTIGNGADLTLTKSHSGNFTQGQTGATYTLTVANAGGTATSGLVTVSDAVPAGLTPTAAAGSGWTCNVSGQDVSCTRSDALAASASYPVITLTVNVAANATNVTNTASVSGGGDVNAGNNGASDATTIGGNPDLTLAKSHGGSFTQGQTGATYTIAVTNSGTAPTSGAVTVGDTVPAGLTPTGASGSGWTCTISGQDVSCTRNDALAASASYPAITLTVNVAANATNVTNTAAVSGGGDVNAGNNSASDATTIGGNPDLTLTKSHSGNFTQGQTGAAYTIAVTNSGTAPTSGAVTVGDTVPAGLTPTGASGSGWTCNITGQDVSCTRSDALAASASYPAITLTVNVAANAANLTNTASVSGGGDVNGSNNSVSDATTIGSGPDLMLSKTHSGGFTQGQSGATYTLTAANGGGAATSGVVTVSDTVPAGLTPTAAAGSGWTCNVSGQDVSCTRGDALAASASYPAITLTVNVAANATDVTNTASVSGGGDVNAGNNSASDATTIGGNPDLTLTKSHSGNFTQGQTGATYVLTVANSGTAATSGAVTASDAVPAGLTPTSAAGSGWTCSVSGQDVSCTRSDALAAGASFPAITLTVNVAANATNLTNTASVSGGGDINGGNNGASDATTIAGTPDLTLTKSHSGNFTQGQTGATYVITVANGGTAATSGAVTASDAVPAGLTPTAAAGSGWTCSLSGQDVSCTRSDALAAGASFPAITLTVNVAANATNLTNTASVSGGGDVNGGNNGASDATTIAGGADLTLSKTHSGNFTQGQTGATYTLTAANAGASATSGLVTVTDATPAGLTPTSAAGSGWTCAVSGQDVSCTRSDALAAGTSFPAITVTVNVAANATNLTNTASVSGGGEVNAANNGASDATTITSGPDVTLTKTHSGSFVQGQTGATYTLTVTNSGASATSGAVTVSDAVPAGLTPTAGAGSGWTCGVSGQDVSCTRSDALGAGASFPAITLTVNVAATATNLTNTASVSGGGDVTTGNNGASDATTIAGGPDVTLTKTHSGSFLQGQNGATYTLTVTNSGASATSGAVTVSDPVPAGLTPTGAAGSGWTCDVTGQNVSCTRGEALAAGTSFPAITLTVNVAANATNLTNTASVSGGGDVNGGNDGASDATTIIGGPDVTLTKTHGGSFLQGQTGATYTLTVTNSGASATSGAVTVSDPVPAGLTPTAAAGSGWTCGVSGPDVSCTRSDALAASQSYPPITLTVDVAGTASNLTNTATLAGGGDVNTANNSASDATTIGSGADVTVSKTHAGQFTQGQTGATYVITVANSGTGATTGAVVATDTVPAGLTPTSAAGSGWTCTVSGQDVSCTRSDALAAGSSFPAITLTVNVAANATDLTNTASVSGGGDINAGNNSASDATTIAGNPDLTVALSHTGNFTQGQTGATYTITSTNSGTAVTSGAVAITAAVPAGLTPTAAAGSGWTCTVSGQDVSCTRSDALAAGSSFAAITLTVNVAANATNLTTTASVSGGGEVNTGNNSASDATTIGNGADLTLTKTHSGNFIQGQTGAIYTLTAVNAGGTATFGAVTVIDTVPAGLTPTGAAGSGWTCTVSGQDVSCTRSDALAAGSSFPAIDLTVNVAANATNLTNTASVSGGGDVNAGNNGASDATTIGNGADLMLSKTHSGSFIQGQTGATYTLTAANAGGTATSGALTVSDTVPAGLTPTGAAGSGWTCTVSGQDVSCSRSDALAAGSSFPAITLTVNVAANAADLTNTASVSGGGDVNTGNNGASDVTTIGGNPDMTVALSHTGNFTQGQTGATYTIASTNSGTASTTGAVTITTAVPAGLTPTAAAGSGWTCTVSGQDVSCARSDALAAGTSFPAITLTVNVAANATDLTTTASVSGGGEVNSGNNSASDATTIGNGADLTLTKTHSGSFIQGQTGATYTLTAANAGGTATSGAVTVSDTVPAGLTPTGAAGSGWTCTVSGQDVSCTRSDALAAGSSFPAVTLTVNVAANATDLTNTASVSGGGDVNASNNGASDATTIGGNPDLTVALSHTGNFTQGQTGATYTITSTNSGTAVTSGAVTITAAVPAGLTPTAAAGSGWTCTVSGQDVNCARSDALAAGTSFPAITLTVNVAANATNLTTTASVSGGGEVNSGNNSASDATTIGNGADLTLTKTHSGNFIQGQTGATYTLTAANSGATATFGAVTVSDAVPAGLTPTAASGSGWACNVSGQDVSCTRSDALAAATSFPAITLTVNVAANATNLTNTASVSGGGDVNAGNNGASDATTIGNGADLTLTKTHSGSFIQGQTGATYTLTAANAGGTATFGAVTVSDTVPAGLTPTAAAGSGWTCTVSGQDVSCTRSDALATGTSFPAITLTVNVAADASNLTNTASVSGGGEVNTTNNSASDATTIGGNPDLTVALSHTGNFTQGQTGAAYTIATTNSGTAPTSGAVTITSTVPAGLTPTAAAGSGWTCTVSGQDVSCTRSDALATGTSFPAITLTVNVAADASDLTTTASVSGGGEVNTTNNSASDATTIGGNPDLTVALSHSGNFTQGQTGATYTIASTNSGTAPTTGAVTITAAIPAGLMPTAVAGTGWTCTVSGQDVSCTRGDALAAGTSFPAITLTVNVAANASDLTTTASVSGGGEVNTANNSASDATPIAGNPDLTLAKSHSGDFTQGQTGATYAIAITNSGTAATSGAVTVSDAVPAGLTPIAAAGSGWTCSIAGQDVSCTRGDALAAGTSFPAITLTVNVAANATNLTNTAAVSGGGDLITGNNNASDATTIVSGPDVTITNAHSGTFLQGQMGAAYTLTVTNIGGSATSGVVTVTDAVPAGLTPAAASGSGWTCTVTGQDVSCTRADALTATQSYPPITLTVNVARNASDLINTAVVAGGGDLNPANNSASDATTVAGAPDLTLTKTHTGSFLQGQSGATYTLIVTNSGTSATSGAVTLSDAVPAGLTPEAAGGPGWTCTVSGQDVSCTRSDALAASQSYAPITLTVNVAGDASDLTNTAAVAVAGDVNSANNGASDATTIGGAPDLTLTKTHSGSFLQGQTGAAYTLTVTNSGTSATSGAVTASDALPAGLTPDAAGGPGWTCAVTGQDVSCTRSDALAAGASYPAITLTVNVAANATGLTNTASVSGGGDVGTSNNSASDATAIIGGPDVTLTKTHGGNFTQGQSGATYTITVANIGTGPTSGAVIIGDPVPAGLTPTAASGPGWTCAVSGQDVSCTRSDALAAGASYPVITLAVNVAATATGLTNTASVSGGGDVNTANNSASDATTIGGSADLTLTKTHTGNFTQGQTGATYVITVTNSGTGATSGVQTLADAVPAGLTPTAAAGTGWACNVSGQDVSCTRSDALAAGQSHPAITITVNVAANAINLTNTASIAGGGDVNTANNSVSDATSVVGGPDPTVTHTHAGSFMQGQTGAAYTIIVTNAGGMATSGTVTVSETLPAGLVPTGASGTGWTCTVTAQDVSCSRSDALAAGESFPPITLIVNVSADAANVTNVAVVSGGGDVNTSNNNASDPTTVGGGPDLTVTKTHSGTFLPGQIGAAYVLTVANTGTGGTSGSITVVDALPAGLVPTAASGAGWTCSVDRQQVSCSRADPLAAGQTYPPITLSVNVAADASNLINTASISGGGDVNTGNNSASDPTTIGSGPDLTLAKSHAANFLQGQTGAVYTLTVANAGGTPTSGVVTVTDSVPAGLTPMAAGGTGWTCHVAGQDVSCTRNDALDAGQRFPAITLAVNVAADAATLTNTAVVSGIGDVNTANNTASDPTTIGGGPDLTLAKRHTGDFTQGQSDAAYVLTVRNVGGAATVGTVIVTDLVPTGLTTTHASGLGWTFDIAAGTASRSDALAAGDAFPPITLTVRVAANASASLTNTATVAGGGDVNVTNNSASDPTTITSGADLTVTKSHAGNFRRGQTDATYILTVTHASGGATAGLVTVLDTVPAGLTPTAATGAGWACAIDHQSVSCTRGDTLAPGQSFPSIVLTVNVASTATDVINIATVSGGGDTTPANNRASNPTTVSAEAADLMIAKAHAGQLRQSQAGTYTLTVTNVGAIATSGLVTVTDVVPSGLTPTAAAGTGWACAVAAQEMTCTRSDALGAGQSFAPITLSVMVAANVTSLTNTATVSGGGDRNPDNNAASDDTTIAAMSGDLVIEKRHDGAFVRGQVTGSYTIVVRNLGPGASDGMVTVIDDLPPSLHLVSAGGDGWTCVAATCRRSDALAANAAYPPLTVRVTVDADAPASVINSAAVSGGGDVEISNNASSDPTDIGDFTAADFQVAKSVERALLRPGDTVGFRIEARNVAGAQLEEVLLTDTLPRGFTYVRGTARVATAGATDELQQSIEAVMAGDELAFAVGTLGPAGSAVIRYTALVSVDARAGRQDSELRGSAMSPLGGHVAAARAQVAVIVMPSSFAAGQVAVGRVFHDADNDGQFDADERGIANVRVLLPSGSSAITGHDGLYNLPALSTGAVVIAVDPATLPAGYHVRRTGRADGSSQLQRTPLGSGALLTQNFPVIAEPGAAPLAAVGSQSAAVAPATPAVPVAGGPVVAGVRTLSMTPAALSLAADGRARTVVTVTVVDADGAPGSAVVHVRTSAGQLLSSYPSDVLPGAAVERTRPRTTNPCATPESGTETPRAFATTDLDVVDGQASVCLVSDLHPGVAALTATTDDVVSLEATATVTFEPVQRSPLLVGVGELSIGAESGAGDAIDRAAVQARGQLFFQDTFAGGSQLTVAVNSEGPINTGAADRLFQLDPLERAYPVFGDSSTRQELAQSNAQVYARFDRGRSHVMFGDLRGDLATPGRSGLGEVARNLTGFRVHVEPDGAHAFTATVSRPDTAFRRDVISGPQFGAVRLSRGPVLPGSETVTVEVRDRRNPEMVLRREVLNRSVDYLLDPLTGIIHLTRTIQLFDDVLNVTNLVVTYDYQVASLESAAYSGRARAQFGQLHVRASAFAQERSGATFVVGTMEAEHALPRGGRLFAEVPVSHGVVGSVVDTPDTGETRTGAAWRVLFEQPFARGHAVVRGEFQRIGEHFLNPFGSPAVAGSAVLSGTLETKPVEDGTFSVTVRQESNETALIDNDRLTLGTRWTQGVGDRFTITGGVDHRRYAEHRAGAEVASYLLTGQAEWRPIARVTILARREQNLADADQTYPNQTVLGGSYQLSRRTKLFVTQRFSAAPIIPISGIETAGLLSPLSTRETSIGIATAVSTHTDVTSKFQLDRGLNGTDAFALVGTRTRVPVRGGFGIDWGFDHAHRVRGDRPGYTSGTVGVAYVAEDRFRGAVHYELRSREELGHVLTAGIAGRLSPDVTVLMNYRLADLPLASALARDTQTLAALAWRPSTSNRYGLLFSWNHGSRNAALVSGQEASRVGRLSTDGYLAPGRGLELHSRLALIRSAGAAAGESTNAYLWQGRIQQRLFEYVDVALEQRATWQTGLDQTRRALGVEVGVWALPDLRLGLGYRTRPVDSNGLPVIDAPNGGGYYFVMTSRLAGFFNLLGRSSEPASAPVPPKD